MKKVQEFLVDWSIRFLENKDSIKQEIKEVHGKKETGFSITYKSAEKVFFVSPMLSNDLFDSLDANAFSGVFALNNSFNTTFLTKNWEKISGNNKLMLYFINPFSNGDKAWIINPYVHNMICDSESLSSGIKALSEMVDDISEDQVLQNIE